MTLDAGSQLNRFESAYTIGRRGRRSPGRRASARPRGRAARRPRARDGANLGAPTRYGENGWLGCGVVVDPAALVDVTEADGNQLAVMRTPRGRPAS